MIRETAGFIKDNMQQANMSLTDNGSLNFMVHTYISDTLTLQLPATEEVLISYPKTYDFNDPFGYEDVEIYSFQK